MKNIKVDANGQFHCWNCGGVNFTHKRTFRSKAAVGVGALLTKKKMKCQQCGKYNDVGSAETYVGPSRAGAPQTQSPTLVGPQASTGANIAGSFRYGPVQLAAPVEAKGMQGSVSFDGRTVMFNHAGFKAKVNGFDREIHLPITAVHLIEWKEPTMAVNGYLRFVVPLVDGTLPQKPPASQIAADKHAILVTKQQTRRFEDLRAALELSRANGSDLT